MFNVKKERSYLLQAFSIQLRHMKILCSAGQTNAVKSKNTTYYKSKILRALSAAAESGTRALWKRRGSAQQLTRADTHSAHTALQCKGEQGEL